MEAVKPLLLETNCSLVVGDDIVIVGERIYVKATAILRLPSGETVTNTAFAREPLSKKGIDESQVTGAASSYARKYALNGLFCIDDNKDADALNTSAEYTQQVTTAKPQQAALSPIQQALNEIAACTTKDMLNNIWYKFPSLQQDANFTAAMTARKDQILNNGKK